MYLRSPYYVFGSVETMSLMTHSGRRRMRHIQVCDVVHMML